jgi:hypothetical protein
LQNCNKIIKNPNVALDIGIFLCYNIGKLRKEKYKMIELEARVIKRVWHNDSFYIYAVEPTSYTDKVQMNKYGNVSITGDIGFLVEGEIYEFILADGKKNQYGVSYPVDDVPSVRLETLSEMSYSEKFGILMNCTSSERLASNILDAYPNFIELVLTEGKEAIDLKRISGVGEVYLNAYVRELTKMFKYYSLCKHETLKPYNISQKDAKALYDIYSNQDAILRAFEDNPYYCLIEICGRKFDNVDKTIVEARNDLIDSFQRTEALIIDVLRLNEYEGSTRLNGGVLYRVVKEDYTNCKNLIPKLKDVAVESQYIYFDEDSGDLSVLDTYVAECNIAQFVKEKIENSTKLDIPNIEQYRTLNGLELTDQQFKAVENLRDYDFSLIIGVSGGGKTSSTQSLINVCDDIGLSYTLLAPTGTASMRLAESTHREATTIHLKCLRDMAINTDVLIVDECSMIGLDVFNMMISAITNPNIKVVLVGDNFQLVSISQGTIFSDIIESEVVPKAMLTKVFRYGESGILYSATNERQGRYFLDDDCVKHENGIYSIKSNYFFIPRSEDEEILEETLNGYFKLIKKGIKPKDILLLTGYNVGDCGALNLNNIIQKELNPPKPNEIVWTKKYRDVKIDFRVGDRIMNIKNNYKALNPESYEMIVQSGGLISKDDLSQDMFSTVYNGQRGVIIELTKDKMVCKFDNDTIVYQKNDLNDYLLLSYAMTIHKSQGSESPYVITIYSPNQKRVMNRNLLYVGDTRAKKKQIDIGDLKTFRDALLVDGVEQRNTWLKELIIKN